VSKPFAEFKTLMKTLPLSRCCLLIALLPTAFALTAPTRAQTTWPPKVIAPKLQPFVDQHVLAGAVTLVATKDKVLNLEAVGYADVAAKKPMQTDDLFWIASMSKPITAAAFMMLVDEGKVNVNDPVEKYLPEFKGQMVIVEKDGQHVLLKKPKHPITIKNILSHTSGLPFKSPIETPTLDILPLATRVRSYAMLPLEFEPDTKYQYSNAGINTAGRIIEVVSGMPYETFLEKRLFGPLGMKDTTFYPTRAQIQRIAKSYKPNKDKSGLEETPIGQLKYPLHDPARQPMPAGGLFSTGADTARFCQMLLNGGKFEGKRYLSEATVKQMTSKQTGERLKQGYGFGFAANGTKFGHGGAYNTNMSIDTKSGLITVFMVQHAGWRNDDGKKILPTFHKAALDAFGK
jgi:CubicO group peptidase (beta-lactamase class C family)